jgi:hypothetical protein
MGRSVVDICPRCNVNPKHTTKSGVRYGYCEPCLKKYHRGKKGQHSCENVHCANALEAILRKLGFEYCLECCLRYDILAITKDPKTINPVEVSAKDIADVIRTAEKPNLFEDKPELQPGGWGPAAA